MNEGAGAHRGQVRQVLEARRRWSFGTPTTTRGATAGSRPCCGASTANRRAQTARRLLAYLQRLSGYSRAQVTRLVSRCPGQPLVKGYRAPEHAFARRRAADALLAEVDAPWARCRPGHGVRAAPPARCSATHASSGLADLGRAPVQPARQRRLPRPARGADQTRATQAATIGAKGRAPGVGRASSASTACTRAIKTAPRACITSTRWTASRSGRWWPPQTISRRLPVIEQMLEQFRSRSLGFHADNGSEYVNHAVARMLDKLRIEFTCSRPRHSNDNGLAGPRTAPWCAGVRLRAHPAAPRCALQHLPPRVPQPVPNFHRPCLFATDKTRTSPDASSAYRSEDQMIRWTSGEPEQAIARGTTLEELHRRGVHRCRPPRNSIVGCLHARAGKSRR